MNRSPELSRNELLKKYNVPGPRYTSYPTVPYWTETPTDTQWIASVRAALEEGARDGVGAALYVHVPFCESLCTYCGCNTRITRNHRVAGPYVASVLKEFDLYLKRLGSEILLSEFHLGGGTPTFLSSEELTELVGGILSRVKVPKHLDFSLEADPRVTRREHLETLAKFGFKRLSLGIQDFDPRVQEIVHRVQSEAQVREVVETARELRYDSVNFDLIYGLPLQTQESVAQTIAAVQRLRPDRIAFYAYAHVPWIKPGQRRFTEADLPDGDRKRALYELGREMLEKVGYREIGMDHFALETDALWTASTDGGLHRNFMGYTPKQVAPLIGLGVSAISDSWDAFVQNEKLLETYQARVEKGELPILRGHVLSAEDQVLRRHILNLMTRFSTNWSLGQQRTAYLDGISNRLNELVSDGLIEMDSHSCKLTERGRPFLRNVCMAFDAKLAIQAPSTQLFSRTI